jgi:hypothetical protein
VFWSGSPPVLATPPRASTAALLPLEAEMALPRRESETIRVVLWQTSARVSSISRSIRSSSPANSARARIRMRLESTASTAANNAAGWRRGGGSSSTPSQTDTCRPVMRSPLRQPSRRIEGTNLVGRYIDSISRRWIRVSFVAAAESSGLPPKHGCSRSSEINVGYSTAQGHPEPMWE